MYPKNFLSSVIVRFTKTDNVNNYVTMRTVMIVTIQEFEKLISKFPFSLSIEFKVTYTD